MAPTFSDAVLLILSAMKSSLMGYWVLVAEEELNRRLETLLKAFLHDHKSVGEIFRDRGLLGTFYSRIEMAAALGLISSDERDDLNLIRKIRNYVAHHPLSEVSFDDEKIKNRCARLKIPLQFDDDLVAPLLAGNTPTLGERESQFAKACAVLVAVLIVRTRNAVRRQTPGQMTESEIRTAIGELSSETEREIQTAISKLSSEMIPPGTPTPQGKR